MKPQRKANEQYAGGSRDVGSSSGDVCGGETEVADEEK